MNAFMALARAMATLTAIIGVIVSLFTCDWTWFARSGAVILAEAIYWFAFFEQRYRLSLSQFIGMVSGETEPRNNEDAALLKFIRERGLVGGDDPIERARSLREFRASVPLLVMQAHVLETRIAIIGTLIWGFGDLPGRLYCG
jgi:hypothetical protein